MKEETGLNTKRRRSADLAKTGDVARLDRFRRRAKGQTPSAAAAKVSDLPVDPHRAISSGDPDTSAHTSGHLAPKQPNGSNSYESDISHLPGRKEDQRMESMSTPSSVPGFGPAKLTKRDLALKVVDFWNEQENLVTHSLKEPFGITVRVAIFLIEDALKGKLHVDHPKSIPNRIFHYRDLTRAISKFNEVVVNPVYGVTVNRWARNVTLRNFMANQSPIKSRDHGSGFSLRNLSPFLFFVDHDMEHQQFRVPKETAEYADKQARKQSDISASATERAKRDMSLQRERDRRINPPKKKSEKEQIAEKIIKLWQETPGLHVHQIKTPQSDVLKKATEFIISALKGDLVVDHPMCVKGRKYNFHDFARAIKKLSIIATDPSYSDGDRNEAKKINLRDFVKRTYLKDFDNKERKWYFNYLSSFMCLTDHELDKKVLHSVGPNYDEKLISDVHDIIRESYDKTFPYNEQNKKDVVRFIKFVDDFIKENKNGLAADTTIKGIAREYCSFVFEENFKHTTSLLFYPSKHSEFFDHCLEMGILYDEYKGRLFKNGSKFFFQLTDAERKAIKNKEKKAKEEQDRISEERRIADEKKRKEELLKNPPKPYDAKEELEKKKRKQEVKSCTARKDEWRKKAKANGNAKEFDVIWFDWARETKIDPSKLDQLKQSIQHLL